MRSSVHQGSTWLLLVLAATLAFAVGVASAQGTCSIYWPPTYQLWPNPVTGTVTQLQDPEHRKLRIRKASAIFSHPDQLPLGWKTGTPTLTGYSIVYLGQTFQLSDVHTSSSPGAIVIGIYWYPRTATPYPEFTGFANLTLTYPCAVTPVPTPPPTPVPTPPPTPVPTPPPPTPVPRPAGPTCTLYQRALLVFVYPDRLRLAIRKRLTTSPPLTLLSDPNQPPLGWDGEMVALAGYIIDYLGVTFAVAGLWSPSDPEYYYPQTASPYPEGPNYPAGDGDLLLSYPCNATPAPPPTICNAFWPSVGPANKSASLTRLSLFRASAVLSNLNRIPLGWVGGPPPNLSGYSLGHLGSTVDVAGLWDGPNPSGQYYNVETVSPFPTDTGSVLLVYPCAP